MVLYIFIWLLLLLSAIGYNKRNAGYDILYFLFFILLLVVASGRAEGVGVDTTTYMSIYNTIRRLGYLPYLEPGWNVLNIIGTKLGLTFNEFLFVPSFLMLFPIFYIAKKLCGNPFWPILIYFSMHIYLASFNVMRQYVAVSYVLMVYYLYFKGRNGWALLTLLFACSIHYSSILCIFGIIFIKYIRITREKIIIFFIMSLIMGSLINNDILQRVSFMYSNYISNDVYRADGASAMFLALIVNIFNVGLLVFSKKEILDNKWVGLYLLYIIVLNLTYKLQLGARINVIFSITQLIALPYIALHTKTKPYYFVLGLVFVFCTLQFYRMLLSNANDIAPYKSVWFG